ncbi:hypothetical protein VTK26DRAFT_3069 [Humicola hyalothermophila]
MSLYIQSGLLHTSGSICLNLVMSAMYRVRCSMQTVKEPDFNGSETGRISKKKSSCGFPSYTFVACHIVPAGASPAVEKRTQC